MIKTDRLNLRNFEITDAKTCYNNWGQDLSLGKFIAIYPMKNIQEMDLFVTAMVKNKDSWVICLKDGTPVGYVSMDIPYPQLGVGEIGYVIGEKFQRNGYAKEAVSAVIKEYLINRDLHLIEAKCNEDNKASQQLLNKIGFLEEARLRDRRTDFDSGIKKDVLIFSITKNEFRDQTINSEHK